jgi:simple sugar transport system ATP-binding protein
VGDRFVLLRRGRSMGDFPKAEMTLEQLTSMMAGGAELESLAHELARDMGDSSPVVTELKAELDPEPDAEPEPGPVPGPERASEADPT